MITYIGNRGLHVAESDKIPCPVLVVSIEL